MGAGVTDLIDAHARVLRTSAGIVARAGVADLDRRTPCAGWDLRALLAHMIGQNYGFASAAEGDGDPAVFADRPVGDDPAGTIRPRSSGSWPRSRRPAWPSARSFMAVIRGGMTLPGATVVRMHLVDYVVHGWDVAKTLGVDATYDTDVLEVALAVAEAVPDASRSDDERAPFRPYRADLERRPARPGRGQPRPRPAVDSVMSPGSATLVTGISEL